MKVPLLDLKQQNDALAPQLKDAFARVLDSGQFILGSEVTNLEGRLAGLTGTKHAIGVSSGTDAILLALMALDIQPGDEVICPSFTFFATAGCIARAGARPVFADSCLNSFNVDVADIARRITPRTKALMPVHLFGQTADMSAVMELAARHQLPVIEDAAQALGAGYQDKPAGSMGAFGTYSFFPSKNLGGFGDSGLLVTSDGALGEKARLLRTHGAKPKYFHKLVGGNFRIDPLQAALINVKLDHLEAYTRNRIGHAAYYAKALGALPGLAGRIVLPAAGDQHRHIWNQYTLRVPGARDALRDFLASREIGTEIYYPRPMHQQECFARYLDGAVSLPVAERLAQESLSIPVYPELRREQQDFVIDAIGAFLKG